ncbi:MAG: BamA/TamA family outer membrane protein [Solirubrobacterales bacterium]
MPRRRLGFSPLFFIALGWTIGANSVEAASFPPSLRFRTVATDRVTVIYHQGLETMARETATLATELLQAHEARYQKKIGRLQLVLSDTEDDPNGFSTPLPYPLVYVRVAAPDGDDDFGNHDGWLRLVLSHELAHSVHLDEARGLIGFGRKVLGRAPYLFPNLLTPTWMIEGLATYEETEHTSFGRGRNPDTEMVVRMAALEDRFPKEDQAVYGLDAWPSGLAPYFFGEAFLRFLTERSGEKTLPGLARQHAGQVIPFLDELTAHKVTGATFHNQWQLWKEDVKGQAEREAEARRPRGLTPSRALTARGIRQVGPRFSPDGEWIAYTSRSLTRFPSIRLVRLDGSEDHEVLPRNGGGTLSWTPDGKQLVYAEAERYKIFATHYDLRALDLATRRVRKITRGMRAYDPDVSPDGQRVVFARKMGDRSELFTIGLDGRGLAPVTTSVAGTEWSSPRWRPQGDRIAAARLLPGGWLDVVLVDPEGGAVTNLTEDRAKDVEPTWTPDGEAVVFRSDRDGVSNLHAWRLADGALLRLTNVVGGAFTPSVAPRGDTVAFADYSSRGYDVHLADLDLGAAPPAEPFVDAYPPPSPATTPAITPDKPYRPLPTLLPRFWTPYWLSRDRETWLGAATSGTDPLFRHAYGLTVSRGTESGHFNTQAFYQYDRFFPTFLVAGEDKTELESFGLDHTLRLNLRATVPIRQSLRSSQALSITWRRERETPDGGGEGPFDLGGIETAWTLSTARQYPYSISPVEGGRLRVAYLREDPALGSDVSLGKITVDGRVYTRVFGESDTLALRGGGGLTTGEPGFQRSFAVGGFPDSNLFDLVRTNLAILRGYPNNAFSGRSFAQANAEYRVPLSALQRGWRSLPVFIRHFHGTLFFDAANAWNGSFQMKDVKTGAGVGLGVDTYLSHRLPLTGMVWVARGFHELGDTRVYWRLGLAF